jgi:hypothetical protein
LKKQAPPSAVLPPEVARRIEGYVPRGIPPALWERTLRPFVVRTLYAARPEGPASVEQYARVLTLIAAWCVEKGIPLDIELVLDPDVIEQHVSTGLKHIPSRGTYRTVLRRLGRMLTKEAPWQPRPVAIPRRKVALPYAPEEVALLWEDAQRQSTPNRRRAGMSLILLGAGAGLDGRWARKVRGDDVHQTTDAVVVYVGEPRPREVVIFSRYEDQLLAIAAEAGGSYLVGGALTHRNRTNKLVARFESGHDHPTLSVPRLRSTWLVEHLARGTRLPELLLAAGTHRVESIDELLAFVPPLGESQRRQLLRGSG